MLSPLAAGWFWHGFASADAASANLEGYLRNRKSRPTVKIVNVWMSDHGACCDCSWEYPCRGIGRGYWNAWVVLNGKRVKWFWSYRKGRWYRACGWWAK